MMKKYNEMDDGEKRQARDELRYKEDNIITLYLSCVERIIKSLFLLNSGGAITILAYIYHVNSKCNIIILNISLVIYLMGLIFAFILVGGDYKAELSRIREFSSNKNEFYNNNISLEKALNKSTKRTDFLLSLGNASAACFLIGTTFGLIGFFV